MGDLKHWHASVIEGSDDRTGLLHRELVALVVGAITQTGVSETDVQVGSGVGVSPSASELVELGTACEGALVGHGHFSLCASL